LVTTTVDISMGDTTEEITTIMPFMTLAAAGRAIADGRQWADAQAGGLAAAAMEAAAAMAVVAAMAVAVVVAIDDSLRLPQGPKTPNEFKSH